VGWARQVCALATAGLFQSHSLNQSFLQTKYQMVYSVSLLELVDLFVLEFVGFDYSSGLVLGGESRGHVHCVPGDVASS
jgi:hypothetical protein